MGETQNDEDAPPTEEEIKELWRKNRFMLWRHEVFHRGLTISVTFFRADALAAYWNDSVPDRVRVHAVAFAKTRRHVPVESRYATGHRWTTVTEIRGNGVLVESTTREGLH
jgi:hypothetical protein